MKWNNKIHSFNLDGKTISREDNTVVANCQSKEIADQIIEAKEKADKWDLLKSEIDKFYCDKEGEFSEDNPEEEGDLITIGEKAAIAFGWL